MNSYMASRHATVSIIMEIFLERDRQTSQLGWDAWHDDTHSKGEMAAAAYPVGEKKVAVLGGEYKLYQLNGHGMGNGTS